MFSNVRPQITHEPNLFWKIRPAFKVSTPIKLTVEFIQSDMADRAALMPGSTRTVDRRVEYSADDMVTIYLAFCTLLALAR